MRGAFGGTGRVLLVKRLRDRHRFRAGHELEHAVGGDDDAPRRRLGVQVKLAHLGRRAHAERLPHGVTDRASERASGKTITSHENARRVVAIFLVRTRFAVAKVLVRLGFAQNHADGGERHRRRRLRFHPRALVRAKARLIMRQISHLPSPRVSIPDRDARRALDADDASRIPDVSHAHHAFVIKQRRDRRRPRKRRVLPHLFAHHRVHRLERPRVPIPQRRASPRLPRQRLRERRPRDLRALLPVLPVPVEHPHHQPPRLPHLHAVVPRFVDDLPRERQLARAPQRARVLVHVIVLVRITSLLAARRRARGEPRPERERPLALDLAPREIHLERRRSSSRRARARRPASRRAFRRRVRRRQDAVALFARMRRRRRGDRGRRRAVRRVEGHEHRRRVGALERAVRAGRERHGAPPRRRDVGDVATLSRFRGAAASGDRPRLFVCARSENAVSQRSAGFRGARARRKGPLSFPWYRGMRTVFI